MLKKSLIFGSAVLFLTALITLTGCPTSADDGDSTIVYGHRIYGWNVDIYQAQQAIDNAVKAGEPVVLEDGLVIQPGELNFKNAQVRINGKITFAGGVMNVTDASVSWAPGAGLTMIGGFYIHREGMEFNGRVSPETASVWFAESLEGIRPTARAAAVREFTLGSKQNYDYSRDSSGVDARVAAEDLTTLYILDKLTIPSGAVIPSGDFTISALGAVDVTGNVAASVPVGGDRLRLGTCSTLTSSRGATIPVPAGDPLVIPNIQVEAERDITLKPAAQSGLWIRGKLTGSGTLGLGTDISDIRVEGGDGNLGVSGGNARQYEIYSTGRVAFANDVIVDGESVINSDVLFGGTLTLQASLGLYGNVILTQGQGITFGGNPVTLGAGKTITLQIIPQKSTQIIPAPLLTVGDSNVVLTPGAGATLTPALSPKDTPESIAAAKRVNLGGGALEITDGTLQVLPDAIFGIGTALTTKIDGVGREFGYLTVANGGSLALTVGGSLVIGNTTIGAPFNFKADGGALTLGNQRITGSAAGTKLAPEKGSTGSITVNTPTGVLNLEEVEINVASNASITINATGGKVALDKGAKIILVDGANGQAVEGVLGMSNAVAGGNSAALTGAFAALTSPGDTKLPVWSVAHRGGDLAEVNITADDPGFILGKSPKSNFTR
jgi:hypothetical protein